MPALSSIQPSRQVPGVREPHPDPPPRAVRPGGPLREVSSNAHGSEPSPRGDRSVMSMSASMHRIKVVNDVSDLVSILRAVDSPLKLRLVQRLGENWLTGEDVEREFGKEGIKALVFFEKLRLIDTR